MILLEHDVVALKEKTPYLDREGKPGVFPAGTHGTIISVHVGMYVVEFPDCIILDLALDQVKAVLRT
jgi:hypothetical protein